MSRFITTHGDARTQNEPPGEACIIGALLVHRLCVCCLHLVTDIISQVVLQSDSLQHSPHTPSTCNTYLSSTGLPPCQLARQRAAAVPKHQSPASIASRPAEIKLRLANHTGLILWCRWEQ